MAIGLLQEMPYYAYRSHFTTPSGVGVGGGGLLEENDPANTSSSSLMGSGAKSLLGGRSGSSGAVGDLQPETPRGGGGAGVGGGGIGPQPTPSNAAARPNDPRFKLLEINPAGEDQVERRNL